MTVSKKSKLLSNKLSYGFCNVSIAALRKSPSHTSEMVSQLLFGEHFIVTDSHSDDTWVRIRNAFDNYDGWIHKKQFQNISRSTYLKINKSDLILATEMQSALIFESDKKVIPLLPGAHLPFFEDGKLAIEKNKFIFKGKVFRSDTSPNRKKIIQTALDFLHAPYLWGGRSEFGIDCSGFSQLVYKVNGIKIPRDAYQQAALGKELDFLEEALPGDLAFFDNEQGKITHVGIILSENEIIHASGTVHVDGNDLKGIYCRETGAYSHHLRSVRRYI